jgi:hypothetical protein
VNLRNLTRILAHSITERPVLLRDFHQVDKDVFEPQPSPETITKAIGRVVKAQRPSDRFKPFANSTRSGSVKRNQSNDARLGDVISFVVLSNATDRRKEGGRPPPFFGGAGAIQFEGLSTGL